MTANSVSGEKLQAPPEKHPRATCLPPSQVLSDHPYGEFA
jgi:hypothetical protein